MGTHWLDIQPRTDLGTRKYHLINFEVCDTRITTLLLDDVRSNVADIHQIGRDVVVLCGEVLDMDCDTGGYNLQCAFSTGYLAG